MFNNRNLDVELEHVPWAKAIETTLISSGYSSEIEVLNVTRKEIAFGYGKNVVGSVPCGTTDGLPWYFWFNTRIADDELARLENVVALIEYEVILASDHGGSRVHVPCIENHGGVQ